MSTFSIVIFALTLDKLITDAFDIQAFTTEEFVTSSLSTAKESILTLVPRRLVIDAVTTDRFVVLKSFTTHESVYNVENEELTALKYDPLLFLKRRLFIEAFSMSAMNIHAFIADTLL